MKTRWTLGGSHEEKEESEETEGPMGILVALLLEIEENSPRPKARGLKTDKNGWAAEPHPVEYPRGS